MAGLPRFREIVYCDFEFAQSDGECPVPVCLVAHEEQSGRLHRLMLDADPPTEPPYPIDQDALFVSFYSAAEMGCHLSLGWRMPANVLDLYVEFRNIRSGHPDQKRMGLVHALHHFGLESIDTEQKDAMRRLALSWYERPRTGEERRLLLNYCESDILALRRLLPHMLAEIGRTGIRNALRRGGYMRAVAAMERIGVPIDVPLLRRLERHWKPILQHLIESVPGGSAVYSGMKFRHARFAGVIDAAGLGGTWPRTPSGAYSTDRNTIKTLAVRYPHFEPLRQLKHTVDEFHRLNIACGSDGRNRVMLSAYSTKTGRNAPRKSGDDGGRYIFGCPAWTRRLIRPETGRALGYIDWEQQEFGIAAQLSSDPAMREAYESGDPYLAFARQAGAVPPGATRQSHARERGLYKTCALAVLFGQTAAGLATGTGLTMSAAENLMRDHRRLYWRYWEWQEKNWATFQFFGRLVTPFGWRLNRFPDEEQLVSPERRRRMLRKLRNSASNFPMQAVGSELMRTAAILMQEQGIRICAPVHDAFLIEASSESIESAAKSACEAMSDASAEVLGGYRLRSEARIFCGRFQDSKGEGFWNKIISILEAVESCGEPVEIAW